MSAKIAAALHEVMSEVGYVKKGSRNEFHRYNYASEADLLATLRPAMVKAGLLLIPSVDEVRPVDEHGNTTVMLTYTLAHKDGDIWPHPIRAAGTGNDKNSKGGIGDKGTYKALTGANKYLLFKLFQIETGDEPEADQHEHAPPPRKPAAVERGTPLREAHAEITNGTASTAPQGKPTPLPSGTRDPKKWATGNDGGDFLRRARTDLATVVDRARMTQWMDEFAWERQAIHEHASDARNDLLNTLISEAQDRCRQPTDLRAAG